MADRWMSFWNWFFVGTGASPGFRRLLNRWMIVHMGIGIGLGAIVPGEIAACANAVLLPLAGILVGLSFSWAGNAQALLEAEEIQELAGYRGGGFREYVFTFQTAILAILTTLCVWALAGMDVFDKVWPTPRSATSYFIVKVALFCLASLTVRECWHVVLGAQWMLLARKQIRDHRRGADTREGR